MAFKMKGSAFKLGNVATKSALKQDKSPLEHAKHRKLYNPDGSRRDPHPHRGVKDTQTGPNTWSNQPGKWIDENTFVPAKDADPKSYPSKDEHEIYSRGEEMEGGPKMKSPLEHEGEYRQILSDERKEQGHNFLWDHNGKGYTKEEFARHREMDRKGAGSDDPQISGDIADEDRITGGLPMKSPLEQKKDEEGNIISSEAVSTSKRKIEKKKKEELAKVKASKASKASKTKDFDEKSKNPDYTWGKKK